MDAEVERLQRWVLVLRYQLFTTAKVVVKQHPEEMDKLWEELLNAEEEVYKQQKGIVT